MDYVRKLINKPFKKDMVKFDTWVLRDTDTISIERAKLIILSNIETKQTKKQIQKALKNSLCFISWNC